MSALKTILVTGSTGNQGSAVIEVSRCGSATAVFTGIRAKQCEQTLVKLNETRPRFNILALTRDQTTEKAKALTSFSRVTLVTGELTKPDTLFSHGKLHGLFLMQDSMMPAEVEHGESLAVTQHDRSPGGAEVTPL